MLNKDEINKARDRIDARIYMCYDLLIPISDNRILATHGNEASLISTKAEMICTYDFIAIPTFIDESKMVSDNEAEYNYVDDYLLAWKGNKVGIIDYDGNVVYPIEYREITFTSQSEVEVMPY